MPLTITSHQSSGLSTSVTSSGGGAAGLKPESQTRQTTGNRIKMDATKIKGLESTAAQLYCDGNYTPITAEHLQFKGPSSDRYDGKTIVANKPFGGITVSSIYEEKGMRTIAPDIANKRAQLGSPTHGFFYQDTDFIFSAAKEYSKLEENEVFRHRSIYDDNFVRDTLDFFTNGSFTDSDVATVQDQMENVVYELSRQIKNGEKPDLTKLQSKLTIGGADVSISQLLEFQKVGKELEGAFDTVTVGQLQTQNYAQMGVAKAVGAYYGSSRGQIGEMFSSAIDRLYDKGIAAIKQTYSYHGYHTGSWNARQEDAVNVGLGIADTLSNLDISTKEKLREDFSQKSSLIKQMVENHCSQFHITASHVGLAGDMVGLAKYFNQWMDKV